MYQGLPYCGAPVLPAELVARFNLDPVLILALGVLGTLHLWSNGRSGRPLGAPGVGWAIAAAAFLSPLCALTVSLFSARVGQHMILTLIAAPLIASALPLYRLRASGWPLWTATFLFFVALWFWHMPAPYGATFRSTAIYWAMHVSLFGAAIWLWAELLASQPGHILPSLAAGAASAIHMGLLGAIFTLSSHPLFPPHFGTTAPWGLTPLDDQQLGGLLMWVPGGLLFVVAAIYAVNLFWRALDAESGAAAEAPTR